MSEINVGERLQDALDNSLNTGDWAGFKAVLDWLQSQGVAVHEMREAFSFPVTDEVIADLSAVIAAVGGVVHEVEKEAPEEEEPFLEEVDSDEDEEAGVAETPVDFWRKDKGDDLDIEVVG